MAATILLVAVFAGFPREHRPTLIPQKILTDVSTALRDMARQDSMADLYDARGYLLWREAMDQGLLERDLRSKLVTLYSHADTKAGSDEPFLPENCSFTGPAAADLAGLPHVVLITYNARNWNIRPSQGVLVVWADRERAEWFTYDDAREQYGITPEEWADPAGKLFGKKAPFQYTFE